jgi:hypothetical protein
MLYDQIQRKGKSIESCESSTTSNEMVNSIEYLNIKIMEIIFNCIPTGTLGAVGQMRLKQVVI